MTGVPMTYEPTTGVASEDRVRGLVVAIWETGGAVVTAASADVIGRLCMVVAKHSPGSDSVANVVTNFGPMATLTESTVTAADANAPASTANSSMSATSHVAFGSKVIAAL